MICTIINVKEFDCQYSPSAPPTKKRRKYGNVEQSKFEFESQSNNGKSNNESEF